MLSHRVRILHLSDLHERGSREAEAWRRRRVLGKEWFNNLKAMLEDGPIDLVCFTGDAADWGKLEEFERTTDFFEAILKETALPWDRFFAVPGNHDIDREVDEKFWTRARPRILAQSPLEAARWMAGLATSSRDLSSINPAKLLARQRSYREWLRTIGRADLLPDPALHPNLGYRQTLRLRELPFDFHVIGFDSAWLCGSRNEAGQILLTQDQIGRLCSNPQGDSLPGFRLLLVHHPLDDLADAAEARRLLGDRVDLLLRGHLHEPEISQWADPDSRLRQMAAGCLYEGHEADQYQNACAVIEISLDSQGRPLRYDIRFRGWNPKKGFWFDDGSLCRGSNGGRVVWEIRPAVEPPPIEPRVREVFVGRKEELQQLRSLLLPESPETRPVAICAVQGMPGVGKSYLADRFATENEAAFPGGYVRLVLDPQKPAETDALRQELTDKLKLRGTGPEVVPLLRERLRHPRTLLHVENVDSPAAERGVVRLLRDLQGCAVIVTGRVHDLGWDEGWNKIPLEPFREALALDQLWTELKRRPATSREDREHRDLVVALGYLPLAIHLAAGYLRNEGSAPGFLRKLKAQGLQTGTSHRGAETADEARAIISASFQISLEILVQQLGDSSDRLLAGFKVFGHAPQTGFGRSLGSATAGLAEEDFEDLTVQAVKLSLLLPISREERPDGAWRVHPLLAELLRQGTDPAEPLQRMTDWFTARLSGAISRRHEPEQIQRWSEVDAEYLALIYWLPLVSGKEAIRAGSAGFNYAMSQGPVRLWIDLFESALHENPPDEEKSELLWGLCQCAIRAGEFDRALGAAQQQAEVDHRRGAEREATLAHGVAADILQVRGELGEALRIREEQLLAYENIGDIRERAVTRGKIADILQDRGQLDEALRIRQEEQLPVYEKIGDVRERAITLGKIADILQERGQLDEAFRMHKEDELPVYERIGDVRERAIALGKIADILQDRGQLDEALQIRQQEEIPVYERIGDVRERAVTLGRIADILQGRGQFDEALRIRQEEEIPVYKKIGDIRSRAVTFGKIADILQDRGQLDEALRIREEEEIPFYKEVGDIRSQAVALGKIADILHNRGQLDEALRIRREEEIPIYIRITDIRSQAVALGKIADILHDRGQLDEALRIRQEEEIPLYEKTGDFRYRAIAFGKIAVILQDRGQLDEALRIWEEEELPVYQEIGEIRERLVTWMYMARVYLKRAQVGDRERANELLCKAAADADRLQIPEAAKIHSILACNALTCG
ncbi:MAG TPA: metallophosphoesterase [Thermoanaerobaculia bacterium]|nr:metallophosphoesterase [Thermoanaerobaculia bacterium]